MKITFKSTCVLFIIASLSGCATIYSGNHDTVHFSTVPQGAKVEINGKPMGVTPVSLELKRSLSKKTVSFTRQGYKNKTVTLKRRVHPLVVLDVLTIVGGLIDLGTSSVAPYKQTYYELELKSLTDPAKVNKRSFYNTDDNYYLITFKGDTIYCEPDIYDELGRVNFTPIGGKRESLSNNDVTKFKRTDTRSWSLLNLNKKVHFNQVYEAHPYWPKKNPTC